VLTLTEILGLVLIISLGLRHFGSVDYFESSSGVRGIISAAALIFFAFIGFEAIVKIGEETKDPQRTIPKALVLSIVISTILYSMVGLSVISIVPYNQLASSSSPLADVALKAQGPQSFFVLSIIALFATANTVLIIQIATSRIVYGISKESSPNALSRVYGKTGTPHVAILLTTAVSILFTLLGDIELVANVTNFATFLVFFAINLALINLKRKKSTREVSEFKSLLTIKNMPIPAICGAISSFIMLFQFDLYVATLSVLVTGLGAIFYKIFT